MRYTFTNYSTRNVNMCDVINIKIRSDMLVTDKNATNHDTSTNINRTITSECTVIRTSTSNRTIVSTITRSSTIACARYRNSARVLVRVIVLEHEY